MKRILQNNRIKSTIINAVLMIGILLCVEMVYETNDDHTISKMIVGEYANLGFVNYYLCRILILIQSQFESLNIFIVSQIIASYLSFTAVLKIILDKSNSLILNLISVGAMAMLMLDHYAMIQFTKTSALAITAGFIVIIDCALSKSRWYQYVEGVLLVILGAAYRWNTLLPSFGFACGFVCIGFVVILGTTIIDKKKLRELMPEMKQILAGFLAILLAITVSYAMEKSSNMINRSTEELQAARTYSSLRARLTDFPVDTLYDDYKRECDAIGVDNNDIKLINKWVFDYDGAASFDNLEVLSKLGKQMAGTTMTPVKAIKKFVRGTMNDFKAMNFTAYHILLLTVIALFMLISMKPKYWIYIVGFGGFCACLYISLYYMQRPLYRTLYIADIGTALWLLYTAAQYKAKPGKAGVAVGMIVLIACLGALPLERIKINKKAEGYVHKVRSIDLDNYFESKPDCIFVCEVNGWNNARTYVEPLKAPNNNDNSTSTGGWSTLSPYMKSYLNRYNIENPVKDIIDNENAFYVGNARLDSVREYYNKWYGTENSSIELVQVNEVAGKKVWKIVRSAY